MTLGQQEVLWGYLKSSVNWQRPFAFLTGIRSILLEKQQMFSLI